jgi:hypothetical protein
MPVIGAKWGHQMVKNCPLLKFFPKIFNVNLNTSLFHEKVTILFCLDCSEKGFWGPFKRHPPPPKKNTTCVFFYKSQKLFSPVCSDNLELIGVKVPYRQTKWLNLDTIYWGMWDFFLVNISCLPHFAHRGMTSWIIKN